MIVGVVLAVCAGAIFYFLHQHYVLNKIIERLTAQTRLAQVLVTGVNFDEGLRRNFTTVKFLEYTSKGEPLEPQYFTFPGHILQFQALVVRFDDRFVKAGDKMRGKSVALFLKAFALNGPNTKEFIITPVDEVPLGYRTGKHVSGYEKSFWRDFWKFAFDPAFAKQRGVKNVQIEAPGTMFIPGFLYTIVIEHDGGLRIDTKPLPEILKNEKFIK